MSKLSSKTSMSPSTLPWSAVTCVSVVAVYQRARSAMDSTAARGAPGRGERGFEAGEDVAVARRRQPAHEIEEPPAHLAQHVVEDGEVVLEDLEGGVCLQLEGERVRLGHRREPLGVTREHRRAADESGRGDVAQLPPLAGH